MFAIPADRLGIVLWWVLPSPKPQASLFLFPKSALRSSRRRMDELYRKQAKTDITGYGRVESSALHGGMGISAAT